MPADVPPIITTTEGGNTSTGTSTTPYPGAVGAINRAEGAGLTGVAEQEKADEAQKQADEAAIPGLENDAAQKDQQAQVEQNNLRHLQEVTDNAQRAKAAADAQLGGTSPQFHNLLENASTGKKLAIALGMGVTGLSGNVEAQKAQAAAIDNMIKNDFNTQRENYNAKLNFAKQKGEDVNELYKQYEQYQGFSHAAEQKANEAVLAHIVAEAKKNGIPVEVAMRSVAAQNAIRNIEQSKANSFGSYARHYQATTQTTPKTVVTEGKEQGKGGKAPAPVANFDAEDFNALTGGKVNVTGRVGGNLTRELTKDPNFGQKLSGALGGGGAGIGGPANFRAGESPDENEAHDVVGRIITSAVKLQTEGKRPPKAEDYTNALHSLIPMEGDAPSAKERKINNLKRLAAQPGVLQGGPAPTPAAAPGPAPSAIPEGARKVRQNGVKGYLLPDGKFQAANG